MLGFLLSPRVAACRRICSWEVFIVPSVCIDVTEKLEARGNRYLYEINRRWTIDGSTRRNLGRYANHSCRPNAESYQIGHSVFLRAIKNIKRGDEITYDYGTDYLNNVITRRGCKCDKCRNKRAEARARLRLKHGGRRRARRLRKRI